jgi:putative Holliday junction resolvase
MRIIGIDFGERRIGVAAADDRTRIAIPVTTVEVAGDPVDDLVRIAEEQSAGEIVIGLPLSLTGAEGPQARRVREVAESLAGRIAIPVRFQDERLTSAQAEHAAPRNPRGRGKARPAANRDAVAAAILLQAYIDSRRSYD